MSTVDNVWFFAYGWAMDKSLLKKVVGDCGEPMKALLRGYRLSFDTYSPSWRGGVASIVEDPESIVYGAVYKLSIEQMSKLDNAVGVPSQFARRKVLVDVERIGVVEAVTYVSTSSRGRFVKPSEQYVSVLIKGLRQLGYGEEIIEKVKKMIRG
ncbi:MAG: gamma-glutamylcyclotransferase family protein [Nitrososphaerota archaeon]